METLWHDLRVQLRSLSRSPGFTLAAVLTLAVGIGANTAIFNVVYTVLLRPLPFAEPHRLLTLWENHLDRGVATNDVTPGDFFDWREQLPSFTGLAAYHTVNVTLAGDPPDLIVAQRVSPDLFRLLGVTAAEGRTLVASDEPPGAEPVVLLSHALWQQRFGRDPSVVGRTLTLDGEAHTVAGVMPEGFGFPNREVRIWLPLRLEGDARTTRREHFLQVVGRLAPGVSPDQAAAQADLVSRQLADAYPETNEGQGITLVPLHERLVGDVRFRLLILLGAVGLVLLIGCTNVANLWMVRSTARRHELAVRTALGASRTRLARLMLTESVILAVAGGALGLGVHAAARPLLGALAPPHLTEGSVTEWSGVLLVVAAGLSVATGLAFGLVPAWQAQRLALTSSLKDGGRGVGDGRGAHRARATLVVAEVALATVLLVGAGLLVRSFWKLQQLDPGFVSQGLLTMRIELPEPSYPAHEQRSAFRRQLLEAVTAIPGVDSAGLVTMLPLTFGGGSTLFTIEGRPPAADELPAAVMRAVTPDYFRVMRIPLRSGRAFTTRDLPESPPVVLINEALAEQHFPGANPNGQRLLVFREPREIVGVVGDVRHADLETAPRPTIYVPTFQRSFGFFDPRDLAVRSAANPIALTAAIRAAVSRLDPDQPISRILTMDQILGQSVAGRRLQLGLLTGFAGVALLLAAIGIYGVMSFALALRTQEIGIRMALGASRRAVVTMVVTDGLRLTGLGLGLGLFGAWSLSRLLDALLFEVDPGDPLTLTTIIVTMLVVATTACYLPGHRASRLDPLTALRRD